MPADEQRRTHVHGSALSRGWRRKGASSVPSTGEALVLPLIADRSAIGVGRGLCLDHRQFELGGYRGAIELGMRAVNARPLATTERLMAAFLWFNGDPLYARHAFDCPGLGNQISGKPLIYNGFQIHCGYTKIQ